MKGVRTRRDAEEGAKQGRAVTYMMVLACPTLSASALCDPVRARLANLERRLTRTSASSFLPAR